MIGRGVNISGKKTDVDETVGYSKYLLPTITVCTTQPTKQNNMKGNDLIDGQVLNHFSIILQSILVLVLNRRFRLILSTRS